MSQSTHVVEILNIYHNSVLLPHKMDTDDIRQTSLPVHMPQDKRH